jgi:hypothetical protein
VSGGSLGIFRARWQPRLSVYRIQPDTQLEHDPALAALLAVRLQLGSNTQNGAVPGYAAFRCASGPHLLPGRLHFAGIKGRLQPNLSAQPLNCKPKTHPQAQRKPGSPHSKKWNPLLREYQCDSIRDSFRKYRPRPFRKSTASTPNMELFAQLPSLRPRKIQQLKGHDFSRAKEAARIALHGFSRPRASPGTPTRPNLARCWDPVPRVIGDTQRRPPHQKLPYRASCRALLA